LFLPSGGVGVVLFLSNQVANVHVISFGLTLAFNWFTKIWRIKLIFQTFPGQNLRVIPTGILGVIKLPNIVQVPSSYFRAQVFY